MLSLDHHCEYLTLLDSTLFSIYVEENQLDLMEVGGAVCWWVLGTCTVV